MFGVEIKKNILSQIDLYYGYVSMPKGFEIDREKLSSDILQSTFKDSEFPFSKTWDMLNTYIREHINVEYGFQLINKQTWGDMYKANQQTVPLLNINPVDLKNSPDYTCLYGIKVDKCIVRIHYDDNRRKGRSWDIELKNNMFIIFPSTNMYHINNNQKDNLNFIQTITYEYI